MELSATIKIINNHPELKKSETVLILASAVSAEKLFSIDFICQNLLDNYDPDRNKKERGSFSAILSNLVGDGLIWRQFPPFDPQERISFAKASLEGALIDNGPRKTKFVFQLTKTGLKEVKKILNNLEGLQNGELGFNNRIHSEAQLI
jgi:hypothetical protein